MKIELTKLSALAGALRTHLVDPRSQYFDPDRVLDFFDRYAGIRDALVSGQPILFADLPIRTKPKPSETSDHDGRGYIFRHYLTDLLTDIDYCRDVLIGMIGKAPSIALTRQGLFLAGERFDALLAANDLITSASSSIDIIDNYPGERLLSLLAAKAPSVSVRILSKRIPETFKALAVAFNSQYGKLELSQADGFHDRFMLIDRSHSYHFGASIKDLGAHGFMYSKLEEPLLVDRLRSEFDRAWTAAPVILRPA
jgi:hypothetical protein